jgi:hypothetical protein
MIILFTKEAQEDGKDIKLKYKETVCEIEEIDRLIRK